MDMHAVYEYAKELWSQVMMLEKRHSISAPDLLVVDCVDLDYLGAYHAEGHLVIINLAHTHDHIGMTVVHEYVHHICYSLGIPYDDSDVEFQNYMMCYYMHVKTRLIKL